MAAGHDLLSLALEITANPAPAEASMAEFQAQMQAKMQALADKNIAVGEAYTRQQAASKAAWDAAYESAVQEQKGQQAVAESVQKTTASFAEQARVQTAAANQELEQLGLVKDAWMQNAAAAREAQAAWAPGEGAQAGTAAAAQMDALAASEEVATAGGADFAAVADTIGVRMGTMAEDTRAAARGTSLWHNMNQGVIGDLRLMRYSMYAFTTPLMFAYVIPQVEKFVEWIQNAASALGGYDAELKALEADARKASEAALTNFGALPAAVQQALAGVADQRKKNLETLQAEHKRAEQQMADIRRQIKEVEDLSQAKKDLLAVEAQMAAEGQSGTFVSPALLQKQLDLTNKISRLTAVLGPTLSGNLGKALTSLTDDLDKGNKALTNFQNRLNELKATAPKAAASAAREAAKAEKAQVRAAEAHYKELVRIEKAREKEIEDQAKHAEATGKAAEQEIDKALAVARRKTAEEARQREQFNRGTAGILHGYMPPLPAGIQAQAAAASAANEAAGHIDIETQAVWNLQAALLGLAPVADAFNQKHRLMAQMSNNFADAMGHNIAAAIIYGNSIAAAAEKAAKGEIASLAARAIVHALYSAALGLFYLGEGIFGGNPKAFAAAAHEFEAAAVFGAVGGAAAVVAHAIPGGGGRRPQGAAGAAGAGAGGGSSAGRRGGAMASPTAPGARGPQYPGGGLTVAIMGNEEAGQWLATTLTTAVEMQGVRLVSSTSKTSAPVGQ